MTTEHTDAVLGHLCCHCLPRRGRSVTGGQRRVGLPAGASSQRWRLTEATLGLVVAMAADSPEITSAITASAHGQGGIGAGVVLGSNVFNLAALLGLGAIVARRVHLHRKVVTFEGVTATWVALVSIVVVSARIGVPGPAWSWPLSS